ncbi:unnamed protein product [Vicia faba]|uniref:Uncharacterized protein n=1 Tax=Vicia faba TaxID=3906 RepID=A0AAV0YU84_VICFA|nr:unnamed protein product [Vicia faba]
MTCIINNETVFDNDFQWKFCDHSKKFVFIGGTTLKAIDVQNVPQKSYYFKDFSNILGGKFQHNRLEYVIGVAQEINNFQYNTPEKKTFVSLNLKDLKGNMLNCTLWRNYETKFLDYYHDKKYSGAILLINEDISEITEFFSKLPANEQTEKPTQSLKSMSLWSGTSQFTTVERFIRKAKCISLSELCKDMLCVTVTTIQKFFVSKHSWFYYGYTKYSLKAYDINNPYKCSCGENVAQAIPRYIIDIYVIDAMLEEGEDDPVVYPDEFDMLLGKRMTFRAKVQPTFGQASVWKLSYDEEFVKEIEKDYITDEGHSIPLTQIPVIDRVDDSMESLFAFGEMIQKIVTNTTSKDGPITHDIEDSECQVYGTTQFS